MFYCIDVNFYFKTTNYFCTNKTLSTLMNSILRKNNYQIIPLNHLICLFIAKTTNQLQMAVKKNKNGCNLQ